LLFDDKVYCPFHFASFSVKTGMHEFGPTFQGIPTYEVTIENNRVFVAVPESIKTHKLDVQAPRENDLFTDKNFVIVGGGPSGLAAAEALRQSGFGG
jgi:NADPH-dependent 2,4-dienoyl-CoA reductase/sulfur reductase-like enzyme